jgi:hypothetical protein
LVLTIQSVPIAGTGKRNTVVEKLAKKAYLLGLNDGKEK